MRKVVLWVPLGVLILLVSSCPTSVQTGPTGGSLVINLPLTDMQPAKGSNANAVLSYDVLGAGPGNASFQELGITATSVTIDSLAPGDWGVTVNGINNLKMPITTTSIPVTIVTGMTASAEVVKSLPVGTGKLDLSLTWTATTTISSATFSLTPQNGAPFEVPNLPAISTVNGVSSIQATVSNVPEGFYTLSRVYKDGSSAVTWGAADTLQIISGSTTKLVLAPGDNSVTITPDIPKVIQITFKGQQDVIMKGEVVTITATPSEKVRSYQWYLNGVLLVETTPKITIGQNLQPGKSRLDVVVSAKDALSSNGITITVK